MDILLYLVNFLRANMKGLDLIYILSEVFITSWIEEILTKINDTSHTHTHTQRQKMWNFLLVLKVVWTPFECRTWFLSLTNHHYPIFYKLYSVIPIFKSETFCFLTILKDGTLFFYYIPKHEFQMAFLYQSFPYPVWHSTNRGCFLTLEATLLNFPRYCLAQIRHLFGFTFCNVSVAKM